MALASGVLCKASVQVIVAVAKTVPGQVTQAGKRSRIWPILRCSSFAFRPSSQPLGSGPACRPLPIHFNHSILGQSLLLVCRCYYCVVLYRYKAHAKLRTEVLYIRFVFGFYIMFSHRVLYSRRAFFLRLLRTATCRLFRQCLR